MNKVVLLLALGLFRCGKIAADLTPDAYMLADASTADSGADDASIDVSIDVSTEAASGGFPFHAAGQPGRLAVDDTYVYWTESVGNVRRIGKDGSDPRVMVKNVAPFGIAADSTGVYFTDVNAVMKLNPDGGAPIELVPSQVQVLSIALDGTHVFWTDFGIGTVKRADLDGSNVITIGTGSAVRWLAVGGGYVFWASGDTNGALTRADVDGGNPKVLATTGGGYNGVATGATRVFFVDQSSALSSVPFGGTLATTIATSGGLIWGMPFAALGEDVFWSWGSTLLMAADGGAPVTLTNEVPMTIAVDANYVFWFDNGFMLSRLPKP